MIVVSKNDQGRFLIKGTDDVGFKRNNTTFFGVTGYEGILGEIIGRILSLFNKAVRLQITDEQTHAVSNRWFNVNSVMNLAARNTNNEISAPKSFTSKSISTILETVIRFKDENWLPKFSNCKGPLSKEEMGNVREFFTAYRKTKVADDLEEQENALIELKSLMSHSDSVEFYVFNEELYSENETYKISKIEAFANHFHETSFTDSEGKIKRLVCFRSDFFETFKTSEYKEWFIQEFYGIVKAILKSNEVNMS